MAKTPWNYKIQILVFLPGSHKPTFQLPDCQHVFPTFFATISGPGRTADQTLSWSLHQLPRCCPGAFQNRLIDGERQWDRAHMNRSQSTELGQDVQKERLSNRSYEGILGDET